MPSPLDALFAGGGEMGRRMRAHDWSGHPFGPPERWPQSLRAVLRLLLASRYPMFLGWGPDLVFFYNDAYIPVLGARHPAALGQKMASLWREIWSVVGPQTEAVVRRGESTWNERTPLLMLRNGFLEETYFTFSYSPAVDDDGSIAGVFCVCMEETARVVGERRLALLRDLAARTTPVTTQNELHQHLAAALCTCPQDVPFALLYQFSEDGTSAELRMAHGLPQGHALAPAVMPVAATATPWPLTEVHARGYRLAARPLPPGVSELPRGLNDVPPGFAALVPISQPAQKQPAGVLVVGLNPLRPFDDDYRGFLDLLTGQIAATLVNARAREADRQRAEALAALDRTKTEFFSNVSHEFRTPLTLMLAPLEDELRAQPENPRLQTAHRNSLRLLKLVNTLLDFSRLEAGRLRANYVPTELGSFTAELASAFHPLVEQNGLRFIIDCPPLPEPVHVDRAMWEKIVFNLLSNAFKFTFTGEIAIRLRALAGAVELCVRDTGVGIPTVELPRIFERFHRVEGARSRSHEGTGIGLSLVNQLAQLHGGSVEVESVEGAGTTFHVTVRTGTAHLPADQIGNAASAEPPAPNPTPYLVEAERWTPAGAGGEPVAPAADNGRRARIVVADDNSDMREYIRRLLEPQHAVQTVGDGAEALTLVRREHPDLVISDVMMPQLDGFELLRALRGDPKTDTIPVVLLSARAGEEARIAGVERGADDYLVKPFSARELVARVNTHLELARIRREAAERVTESEARFRHVADNSPLMFWVTEPDGRCIYLNQRWYEFTGQATEDALGFGWLDAVHPEDRPSAEQAFVGASQAHTEFRIEYRLRRHDGVYRWMVDAAAPRFRDGRFLGFVGSVLDITDEREQFEAVARSRSQLQMALEAGRTGTFDWDMPTGTVTWSPELEKLYGLTEGAFGKTYRSWVAHVVPEDVAEVESVFRRCFEERREEATYQFRAVLPDGSRRWMEGKAKFYYNAQGAPRRMVGINVDIDERKRAELNVHFLNRLGQEIALLSDPDAIATAVVRLTGAHLQADRSYFFTTNSHTTIAAIEHDWARDAAASGMKGRYPTSSFGTPALWAAIRRGPIAIDDITLHPDTQSRASNYAAHDIRAWAIAPYSHEGRWMASLAVTAKQPRRWSPADLSLLEHVVARMWPLIERARSQRAVAEAELKIRASEERLRTAIDAAQLGTWDINPRTRELRWDARCRELFGEAFDERTDYAVVVNAIHGEDRARVAAAIARAFDAQSGGRFDEEYRVMPAGRPMRWVRASGRVLFERGEPIRFTGTMLDVTHLAQARETLAERRNELERIVAERTTALRDTVAELEGFSYSISHDLRAPLRAMQSFAQLLAEECAEQISDDGRDYLRRIITASNRMDRLIHDVLVYSQVARTELQLSPVDLQALVDGIVESYPQFQPSAVDIAIARDLPRVLGNEAALTQCVSNLLGNAVKFVAKGTRPKIEVSAERHGARVHLCVKDNGIGIDPAAQHKIFGMFERLGRDYEGTGIGLAVVRKAAERMGGSISVKSELGAGSTFCLELSAA
jgi:PAS domain S-box-containing protein